MVGRMKKLLGRLHRDDAGAMSIEKVLLIVLIALPIVIVLAVFRETILTWFKGKSDKLETHLNTNG